jgi:hypothetical protein
MDAVAVYVAPSNITSLSELAIFVRVNDMAHQLTPLPSVYVLAMPDSQWRQLYPDLPADVARFAVPYIYGMTVVVPWDTAVALEPGLTWEMDCIRQGWLYRDPPNVFTNADIPIGPNYGTLPGQPNYYIADLLFMENDWRWLLWA